MFANFRSWFLALLAAFALHGAALALWAGWLAFVPPDHGPPDEEPIAVAWVEMDIPGAALQAPAASDPPIPTVKQPAATEVKPEPAAAPPNEAVAADAEENAPAAEQTNESVQTAELAKPAPTPASTPAPTPAQVRLASEEASPPRSSPQKPSLVEKPAPAPAKPAMPQQQPAPATAKVAPDSPLIAKSSTFDPRAAKPAFLPPRLAPEVEGATDGPAQSPPSAVTDGDIAAYAQALLDRLTRNKRYPPLARARGLEGVAELTFSVDREGRVRSRSISRSSGHPLLDKAALALVDSAGRLPPPPGAEPERIFRVPVAYGLH